MTARRGGFTLVEAIVALALSSVLVVLVGTTFLVQNQYYALQVERSAAQDNARMVTEMVASEIRSVMAAGVVTAENTKLVVRSPISLAVVCAAGVGPKFSVHIEGGDTTVLTEEVSGVALRDSITGAWTYKDEIWKNLYLAPNAAPYCYANGSDTVGAKSEFHDLKKLNTLFGTAPPVGSIIMLYRTVEYTFAASALQPNTLALYRKVGKGTAVEFATGMDGSAQFLYRRSGRTDYDTKVGGKDVDKIISVRIEAQARRAPQTGGVDDVTYGWGVNVMLRNIS